MMFKKELPLVLGYYWFRNLANKNDKEPRILEVRDYAGRLAIGNSVLENWKAMEDGEWAGPIPRPENE